MRNCRGSASAINFDALIKRSRFEPTRRATGRKRSASERAAMTRMCIRAAGGIEFPNLIALCRAERGRERRGERERERRRDEGERRNEEWVHTRYGGWLSTINTGAGLIIWSPMSNQPPPPNCFPPPKPSSTPSATGSTDPKPCIACIRERCCVSSPSRHSRHPFIPTEMRCRIEVLFFFSFCACPHFPRRTK